MIAPTRALFLAAADMLRPRVAGTVLIGIALTITLFVALQVAAFALLWHFGPDTLVLPLVGAVALHHLLSWGSLALFPLLAAFLMVPVAAGFAGLFSERVTEAVEQIHYPARIGQPIEIWEALMDAFAIVLAVLAVGIVLLITSPFLGPLAPVLFYGLNGWLLGREFFTLAARRHLSAAEADALRARHGGAVLALGVVIAFLLTVPLLAIAVPVLAAAAFTHLFHGLSGDRDIA